MTSLDQSSGHCSFLAAPHRPHTNNATMIMPSFAALRTAPLRRLVVHKTLSFRKPTRGALLVGSASCLVIGLRRNSSRTSCAANNNNNTPPPRFGMSVRYKSSSSGASSTIPSITATEEEDCPICRKYSQGPCGELFKTWLKCTEDHKGVHPTTKEELHLSKCSHLATPLGECLETHKDFYDNLNVYNDEEEEEELHKEWTSVVREVEKSAKDSVYEFPDSLTPELQIRPSNNTGMAAFVFNHGENSKPLTLCYVKDAHSGELLAAGSLQDLWEWQDKYGVLKLRIPPTTQAITACALYDDALYSMTQRVPPKPDS